MEVLERVITMRGVANQLELSEQDIVLLVESGFLTPYRLMAQDNGKYLCVKFFGHLGGKYPQREYFRYDWERYDIVFDCRDVQAYMDRMPSHIEDDCVCTKPDPDFVPSWQVSAVVRPWEREEREKAGTPEELSTVAGWLEMARRAGKEKEIELLAVGLEWLRGDCTQEKAYHAAFGGEGKLSKPEAQKELERRKWFVMYAEEKGLDFSRFLPKTNQP
mgnify:FL=1